MAQIDDLIAAMMARGATALILNSDQPAQLLFGGTLANGAVVSADLLREMLREIVPLGQKFHLAKEGAFEFPHACSSGTMNVQVERRGAHFSLVITPQYAAPLFATSANSSQVSPSMPTPAAPLYMAPQAQAAPLSAGTSAPDLSKLGAVLSHSAQANSAPKPSVGVVPVLCAVVVFCFLVRLITTGLGAHIPSLFFLAAAAILIDALHLGVRRGLVDGWADLGPWEWFVLGLFFGFVGIPAYLVARPVYKSALPPARVPPP